MADYDIVSGAITQHIVVTCHVALSSIYLLGDDAGVDRAESDTVWRIMTL